MNTEATTLHMIIDDVVDVDTVIQNTVTMVKAMTRYDTPPQSICNAASSVGVR